MSEYRIIKIRPDLRSILRDRTIGPGDILDLYSIDPERKKYFHRILTGWESYLTSSTGTSEFDEKRRHNFVKVAAYDLAASKTRLLNWLAQNLKVHNPHEYYGNHLAAWIWTIDHSSKSDLNKWPATKLVRETLKRVREDEIRGANNGKAKIVEVGSGHGRDYHYLGRKPVEKIEYLGVDESEAMTNIAKAINPDGNFEQGNVLELSRIVRENQAAVFAAAVLHHLDYKQMGKAVGEIRQVLANNGLFFLSLRYGEGPTKDRGTGLLYYRHTVETLIPRLVKNKFKILEVAYTGSPRGITYINVFGEAQL